MTLFTAFVKFLELLSVMETDCLLIMQFIHNNFSPDFWRLGNTSQQVGIFLKCTSASFNDPCGSQLIRMVQTLYELKVLLRGEFSRYSQQFSILLSVISNAS